MPQRNAIKKYLAGGYYHLYNRGVEKRIIFEDEQDYGVFLSYLKNYLLPKNTNNLQEKLADPKITWVEKDQIIRQLRLNNFFGEIELLAYCLMPNHYHLLVRQKSEVVIDYFMRSLNTRYVVYFNKRYQRVGPLFQGVYKAVLVETDEQLTHLSAYIHRNPIDSKPTYVQKGLSLQKLTSQPSSLPEYLRIRRTQWLNEKIILGYFSVSNKLVSYENFVLGYMKTAPAISSLVLD